MFSSVLFTDCIYIACIVAEVVNAKQLSEGSGEQNDEEELGTGQMAEESGYLMLPGQRGKHTHTLTHTQIQSHTHYIMLTPSLLSMLQLW